MIYENVIKSMLQMTTDALRMYKARVTVMVFNATFNNITVKSW